jgi:hypothetical protein
MSDHDKLLEEGPRAAPEPETAEERSRRTGLKAGGGAIVGGAAVAAKTGFLTKFFIAWFALHGAVNAWRIGSWIGVAIAIALIATYLVLRERRRNAS